MDLHRDLFTGLWWSWQESLEELGGYGPGDEPTSFGHCRRKIIIVLQLHILSIPCLCSECF